MKWFLGILVILAAALVLESGLLAYAMYVLLGVFLASRLMAREWITGLTANRSCHQTTAEIGDRIPMRVTIRQRGWLPGAWVLVEDVVPARALDKRFPSLQIEGRRVKVGMIGLR